jgi:hypothetical protein
MIKWVTERIIKPIYMTAQDRLNVTWHGIKEKPIVLMSEPLPRAQTVNKLKLGYFDDEFEMNSGYILVMGQSNETEPTDT